MLILYHLDKISKKHYGSGFMATNKKQYDKMTKKASPPSPLLKNCFNAFWIGGVVCMIGEGFKMLYGYFKFNP